MFGSWEWVKCQTHLLVAGLNHLELEGRDEQAEADRVLFTNDPDFIPAVPPGDDRVAPIPVSNFSASPGDHQNVLSWVNPPDPDFKKTVIRYRNDGIYPKHPEERESRREAILSFIRDW
jgi:hypothetical protein